MTRVYVYVVDRDFGFAPNPFHGCCTLATCKPKLRGTAKIGDWVIGVGGRRLNATGHCVFAMQVTELRTFDQYWRDPLFQVKRPVRNGSRAMMVGDNIYHRTDSVGPWLQADSHHSNPDGSPNYLNLKTDTGTDRVLISQHFCYFGASSPEVPAGILLRIGYSNGRAYRVFDESAARPLIDWTLSEVGSGFNEVRGDPHDFLESAMRYSGTSSRVI